MDFGEILKLWEGSERRPQSAGKAPEADGGAARRAGQAKSKAAEAQEAWLERYGTPDQAERDESSDLARMSRKDLESIPVDASIDLHGMTSREAEAALDSFLRTAELSRFGKVLIVHGKGLHSSGEPVLAGTVRRCLERRKSIGRFGKATKAEGGGGATWALLKRNLDQRSR